ncbi:MAG: TrkH family potassium uptake protein [Thioalkalivibrionaceae bacterium]
MQIRAILRLLGVLLTLFSAAMLLPAAIALAYREDSVWAFVEAFAILAATGAVLWLVFRNHRAELKVRDGFIVVALFWVGLGLSGSLPFILDEAVDVSISDAVFESVSGLTTTGATVLTGIEDLPQSQRMYRQLLQWLGGMGIIVLAIAVLPLLGIGGMQLFRAETTGPIKENNKLTPRIAETARNLWIIYVALTVACAAAYFAAGMTAFDAIAHSFSTVAIGGFSTYDASLGHFDSALIEMVAVVFMLLSGMNFAMHFIAVRRASLAHYGRDEEWRMYMVLIGGATVLTVGYLLLSGFSDDLWVSLRHALFHVVSIATTTGYATTDFHLWPGFLPVLLIMLSFVGGCAGSTGGGMKVIRVLMLFKQGRREIQRLIHPHAVIKVRLNNRPMGEDGIAAVWGFMAAYVLVYIVMLLLLMAAGHDQVTAFSAVAATLNNLGPGLSEVASNYSSLDAFSKWVLVVAMIMGRLEIFTILVLLTPAFWIR